MSKNSYTISLTKHHILREIWLNPGISRTDLSLSMNLNKSTITKAISDLEEIGIISTVDIGDPGPRGGRRPLRLDISQDFGFILGLEIRTDAVVAAGVSLRGDILFSKTIPMKWGTRSLQEILAAIFKKLESTISEAQLPLIGIGLGMPGTIDPEKGILYYSKPLNIDDQIDVASLCRELTPYPVLIENDGNCCAWGELVFRKSECPDHFLYVLGEFRPHAVREMNLRIPAIGLGLVLDRKLQYGQRHCSGEFQSVFHTPGFLNSFSLSDDELKLFEKDPIRIEAIIRELARNVALLVNVLNLDAVIIGGNFEDYEDMIRTKFMEAIAENWPAIPIFKRQVLFSRMKGLNVAYGAAAVFVEKLFSFPNDLNDHFVGNIEFFERFSRQETARKTLVRRV